MASCRSCGITVARLFAPGEIVRPVDPFESVLIGRPNGAVPVAVKALVEVGAADSAGIRIAVPAGFSVWATGTWVSSLDGAALRVLPVAADQGPGSHVVPLTDEEAREAADPFDPAASDES